jgi:hypothetical protein
MRILYNKLLRAIVLAIVVAAALAGYFALTVYILPQSYQVFLVPREPEPVVADVNVPAKVRLGQPFTITVTGVNNGEEADVQIVSVGFPNLTSAATNIKVLNHNFRQTPVLISKGDKVGSEYVGTAKTIDAQYAIVEAMSRPWASGNLYSLSLQVTPKAEGQFVVFVKSIAFPSWNRAHWPLAGLVDLQKEFVKVYYIKVINA